jgi:glutathione S-transferase
MKLFNSLGPNPRMVRMFAAEKGLALAFHEVDLMGAENRQDAYKTKNPAGQLPCLELDDGTVISEITAICEYLEDTNPSPPLIGSNPLEKAETRMWARRVDLNILEPLANGFRYGEGLALFKDRIPTVPEASDGLKRVARTNLAWLDGLMADRQFICGDRFTMADVMLYSFLDFGAGVGQPLPTDLSNIQAWFERVGARPSAEASLHEAAAAVGMRG